MSDGLNQVRAMRVTELMGDYRRILQYIANIRANPSAEEQNEDGFIVLRRCSQDAQALLAQPFHASPSARGDAEADKQALKRIIYDASVRRFKAQKIYLRATAALRWINSRTSILQGQRARSQHAPALQQIGATLRQEIASVTDQRVELSLRTADVQSGKWLQEDPSLTEIQRLMASGGYGGK
ncbi:hypothetical protein K431DRAFT_280261 [Polychaeton citri CBS 116435]|uniref:Uncharacterized protein n=1 Tax=Polychaeton citri CBS 116435 TaxID=1314669 RepID=A0A9P4QGW2_9PEZI|nr:hypothetical protein K431DRAFT_280261 [Polychaeton citri CBS 116435]